MDIKNKNTDKLNHSGNGKPDVTGKAPEQVLKCINIDCVFNSSNDTENIRNTCNHPNVKVESRYADITIAICSEFRSKKDYVFDKPDTLIEIKSKEKIEITGEPNPALASVEKITTTDLENAVTGKTESINTVTEEPPVPAQKPVIIEAKAEESVELTPSELYSLSDKPGTDFLILRKLYQPYMKRGIVISILLHFFALFLLYIFLVPKDEKTDETTDLNKRIVVVEDIETPKFEPPDLDKAKEDEIKQKEENKIENNTKTVRPTIIPKTIRPNIHRPKDNTERDTTKVISKPFDSTKAKIDSNLTKRDTTKLVIPDSLKNLYNQNAIGLNLWFPKNWKLQDNRDLNLNQKEFNGVIINTDSASEDPGAVTMFLIIDDPQHSAFNRTTYKNPFQMEDSASSGFATDAVKGGAKKMSVKYFIFSDPSGQKNIQVNAEFASQAMYDKYNKVVDAIVRSVKIAPPLKTP